MPLISILVRSITPKPLNAMSVSQIGLGDVVQMVLGAVLINASSRSRNNPRLNWWSRRRALLGGVIQRLSTLAVATQNIYCLT